MMFKMNQLAVGLFLFLSSLFSCQQKGDFKSMNVDDFDNLIQNEDIQRLDVRTLAEYSEGHIAKTININVMDDSFVKNIGFRHGLIGLTVILIENCLFV